MIFSVLYVKKFSKQGLVLRCPFSLALKVGSRKFQDCDIVVKRHLWRDNQSLFGDEVSPYLSQVIKFWERFPITFGNQILSPKRVCIVRQEMKKKIFVHRRFANELSLKFFCRNSCQLSIVNS
jgi:hypothetical protein